MGVDPISIAVISSVAISAGANYSAAKNSKKQAQAQQEANTIQRQQNDLQAARQKRDAIRAARTAYATAQQTAVNQGSAETSSSQGGLASIQSQLEDNLSFLDTFNSLSDQASRALGRANVFASRAQTSQAIASLGMQVASTAAGNPGIFK